MPAWRVTIIIDYLEEAVVGQTRLLLCIGSILALLAMGCSDRADGEGHVDVGTTDDATTSDDTNGSPGADDADQGDADGQGGDDATDDTDGGNGSSDWLADRYPGDDGIADDPAVVWYEDFEQSTIDELAEPYDQARTDGMSFSTDVPPKSPGEKSIRMTAGGDHGTATDLYKLLPGDGYDQLYVRYYVRHEDAPYHHSGMWVGGYHPPTSWPNPQAGTRPDGDDRISVAVEPVGTSSFGRRMDFYNYWMNMRSWMDGQPDPDTGFYGNPVLHRDDFYMKIDEWMCIEFMIRLNDDLNSAAGGELAAWYEDELLYHFTESGPLGYWVRDKFCVADADAAACLDYAPPEEEREQEVLDLQWRTTEELRLNWFWPQNYISDGQGSIQFDDIVVATERIGCIK